MLTQVLEPEHYGVAELDGERVVRLRREAQGSALGPGPRRRLHVHARRSSTPPRRSSPPPAASSRSPTRSSSLIDEGAKVEQHRVKGWWKDTGQLADMLAANRLVLEDIEPRIEGELIDCNVEGRVVVEAGAVVERTTDPRPGRDRRRRPGQRRLHRPLHRDRRRTARSTGSEVEHSILLRGADGPQPRLADGGEPARPQRHASPRSDGLPKTIRMMVGDSSELTPAVRVAGRRRRRDARPRGDRRLRAARGHEVTRARPQRARHHRPALDRRRRRRLRARGRDQLRRLVRRRRRRGRRARRDGASTTRARRCSPPPPSGSAPRSSTRRATTSSTAPSAEPYVESDLPAPIGAYGRSKLGGETSVAVANPRHFIVRSSWLYGHGGKNFVETMLQIGAEQPEVLVVSRPARLPDELRRSRRRRWSS